MKKLLSIFLAIFIFAVPNFSAFAEVDGEPMANDYYISDDDFNKLEYVDSESNNITTYSSGLIVNKKLSLAKDGNNLIIKASTTGQEDVKKCGFTYIKLQQYKNGEWVDYKTFKNFLKNLYNILLFVLLI